MTIKEARQEIILHRIRDLAKAGDGQGVTCSELRTAMFGSGITTKDAEEALDGLEQDGYVQLSVVGYEILISLNAWRNTPAGGQG
jgi:hypothetical protein